MYGKTNSRLGGTVEIIPKTLVLYSKNNTYDDVTGGWKFPAKKTYNGYNGVSYSTFDVHGDDGSTDTYASGSLETNGIKLQLSKRSGSYFIGTTSVYTNNAINLKPYKTLHVKGSKSSSLTSQTIRCGIIESGWAGKEITDLLKVSEDESRENEISINISDIKIACQIGVFMHRFDGVSENGTESFYVTDVWLD